MINLLNSTDYLPERLYIFVNEDDPVTYHNFHAIGQFSSAAFANLEVPGFLPKYTSGTATYLPFAPCERDLGFLSPYSLTALNDYRVEYDAEIIRHQRHRLYPSRFSAIFAFGDYESCQAASKNYGWKLDTVREFTPIEHPLCRAVRVNMEHVSLARRAYRVSMMREIDALWDGYWNGFGNITLELPAASFKRELFDSGVIWEYLLDGAVKHLK